MFVIEHLQQYLQSEGIQQLQSTQGIMIGKLLYSPKFRLHYVNGGVGYLLDQTAVRRLHAAISQSLFQSSSLCSPWYHHYAEDVIITACIQSLVNITLIDARDVFNRSLLHVFPPGSLISHSKQTMLDKHWGYFQHDAKIEFGYNCCSIDSFAFHGYSHTLMYAMFDYLYHTNLTIVEQFYQLHGWEYYNRTLSLPTWNV